MTAPTPDRRVTLPGYDLAPPSDADVRAMLQRVFGDARAPGVWADACRGAQLDASRVDSVEKLGRVAAALARQGGAAATIARSIDIRLRTYARLAARTGATA